MKSETSLEKKTDKRGYSEEAFENDIIVRIPPIKEASIKVKHPILIERDEAIKRLKLLEDELQFADDLKVIHNHRLNKKKLIDGDILCIKHPELYAALEKIFRQQPENGNITTS